MNTKCTFVDVLRGPKIYDMSIFDWVASLLGELALGYYIVGLRSVWALTLWMVACVILGVGVHKLLGVDTMFGYYLGLNAKPDRSKQC
jgi:hypothetical protein